MHNLEDWKQRLIEEYSELSRKTSLLQIFLDDYENSNKMNTEDWNTLCVQRDIMNSYVSILAMRLTKHDLFKYIGE